MNEVRIAFRIVSCMAAGCLLSTFLVGRELHPAEATAQALVLNVWVGIVIMMAVDNIRIFAEGFYSVLKGGSHDG